MKLRVLTYNIRGARGTDGKRDYQRLGEFLKNQKIDIALIQEFDTRSSKSAADTSRMIQELTSDHFSYFAAAPTIQNKWGWYGNAICSKYPITKEDIINISEPHREPRNILEVVIETPFGPLHVMNTHKGLNASERGLQIKKLNQLLARESAIPLVLGGDINHWNAYARALRTVDEALHSIAPGPTFPTVLPVFKLDRLWCRPAHLFDNAFVLRTKESRIYSDHYPLLAEIKFNI